MLDPDPIKTHIFASPDEENDTSRLIYADWIQEGGDEERAEFIRLDCKWETEQDTLPTEELQRRHALLRENVQTWLDGLPEEIQRSASFSRGFLECITVRGIHLQSSDIRKRIQELSPDLYLHVREASPDDFQYLHEFNGITGLGIDDSMLDTNAMELIGAQSRIKNLSLESEDVDDASLEHIANLSSLEELWLEETGITNDGIRHLRALTKLQTLSLRFTNVSSYCLRYLRRLPLQQVLIYGTRIARSSIEKEKKNRHFANVTFEG